MHIEEKILHVKQHITSHIDGTERGARGMRSGEVDWWWLATAKRG